MTAFHTVAVLALAVFLAGCKRHRDVDETRTDAVIFEKASIAMTPGAGWTNSTEGELHRSEFGELCPPVLEGSGGHSGSRIQVSRFAERSSADPRAAEIRKQLEAYPGVIKSSVKQEKVDSKAGLSLIHVEYNSKAEEKDHKWLVKTHLYLFKNSKGHCVAIAYLTPASKDSPAVHDMIRNTLVLR